ncbi:hypothetical protein V5799_006092 [Amblyomma americanum]|uniref:Uncharacterized protein n=1 Tax=Amblyomma americanum TaxID=6943 RepID=A0AAQ4DXD8_AMBAM
MTAEAKIKNTFRNCGSQSLQAGPKPKKPMHCCVGCVFIRNGAVAKARLKFCDFLAPDAVELLFRQRRPA